MKALSDVQMDIPSALSPASRLHHKKSRKGCHRCKARGVKCDEQQPDCGACRRYLKECVYPPSKIQNAVATSKRVAAQGLAEFQCVVQVVPPSDLSVTPKRPEHRRPPFHVDSLQSESEGSRFLSDDNFGLDNNERRRWEIRLMQNYLTKQAEPLRRLEDEDNSPFNWGREVPEMAMEHDCILYGVLAQSALHMWTQLSIRGDEGSSQAFTLRYLQQRYLGMALRLQSEAVETLSPLTVDVVCVASLLLTTQSFALVQTLPAHPWEPPLEWLRSGRGVGHVFMMARPYVTGSKGNCLTRFLQSPPFYDIGRISEETNRRHLLWLMDTPDCISLSTEFAWGKELDDQATRRLYHQVLSYIGYVELAVARPEPAHCIIRMFIGFPIWIPEVFVGFLVQRRPRAMVLLGYFFSLCIPFEHLWKVRYVGRDQLRAICNALEGGWREKLASFQT